MSKEATEEHCLCLACGSKGEAYHNDFTGWEIRCGSTGLYGGYCFNCDLPIHFENPVGTTPSWECPSCGGSPGYTSYNTRNPDGKPRWAR